MACFCGAPNCPCDCGFCPTTQSQTVCPKCHSYGAATPTPYYETVPMCVEDHCKTVYTEIYSGCLNVENSWVVPNCAAIATLRITGLKSIQIGSYLWDPTYGYFLIVGFNANSGQVIVSNPCIQGNAAPGTEVPACLCMIPSDTPCAENFQDTPYLAEDFTAPAVLGCVQITVTSITGLVAGINVSIGSAVYLLQSIDSSSLITICNNDGTGFTPGTTVSALDSNGFYQYPLTQAVASVIEDDEPVATTDIVNTADPTLTNTATLSIVNSSPTLPMYVQYTITAWVNGDAVAANTGDFSVDILLEEDIDGGGAASVSQIFDSLFTVDDAAHPYGKVLNYVAVTTVPAGTTKVIDGIVTVTWAGDAVASYDVSDLNIKMTAIGVLP